MSPRAPLVAVLVLLALGAAACRDRSKTAPRDAAPMGVADAAVAIAPPEGASPVPKDASSPAQPVAKPPPLDDAGAPSACALLAGPSQQSFVGPATLATTERGVEIVRHRGGVAQIDVVTPEPIAASRPTGRVALPEPAAERSSRPSCAVAGPFVFCPDADGNVRRSRREGSPGMEVVARALPGTRAAAVSLGGDRTLLGYVQTRQMSDGTEMHEVWARLDADAPVRISEDGAGASDVSFALRKPGEVVALMTDARVSMTPIHARELRVASKLEPGPDVVVHVAGGSTRFLSGVLGTPADGAPIGLFAAGAERGFGLLSVPLPAPLKEDMPSSFSPYPNGLDGAPLAATSGGAAVFVARVRPTLAPGQVAARPEDGGPPVPSFVLELGRVGAGGTFESLGLVATQGRVTHVSVTLDAFGALWLLYTDASGTWLERRACPT